MLHSQLPEKKKHQTLFHRITEWFGLVEETFKNHLVQPPSYMKIQVMFIKHWGDYCPGLMNFKAQITY